MYGDEDSDFDFELEIHPDTQEEDQYNDPAMSDAENFTRWATRFNKRYSSVGEYEDRLQTWRDTRDAVNAANEAAGNNPNAPHLTMNNMFADGENRTGRMASPNGRHLNATKTTEGRQLSATDSIDWKPNMTGVKDQGNCGSCYAFASNSALEAMVSINSGNDPVRLSEQELVSCSGNYGNYGCNGGLEIYSWEYQKQNYAIKDEDYPYTSGNTWSTGSCAINDSMERVAKVDSYTGWYDFTGADEIIDQLQYGPVTLGIQGENTYFYQYESGILDSSVCAGSAIDHAVVIVGFEPGTQTDATEPVTEIVTYTKTRCRRRRRSDFRSPTGCARDEWYVHDTYRRYCCKDYEFTEEVIIEDGSSGTSTDAYFLVQNSWGTGWGEGGFVKFAYEPNSTIGACGMNREPFQVYGSEV